MSLFKGLTTSKVYNIYPYYPPYILTPLISSLLLLSLLLLLVPPQPLLLAPSLLRFSIITSTTNICYTREVRDSNIKVNIYTIRNRRIIGYILAVDILYSFVNVKWGNKLLKVLFLLRILKINKYLIILILLLNFIVHSIYKGLIAGIIIINYLGTTTNNKACL